jgi:drug/metabolite transporter (DMT)-like permease
MSVQFASIGVTAAVAGSGLLHAGWNAAAHRISDRAAGQVLIGLAAAVVSAVALPFVAAPAAAAWPYLLASAVTHVVYMVLLLRSYELGDFSQTYPLARGISPLVVGLITVTVVGQPLPPLHALGLGAVTAGLALVTFAGGKLSGSTRPALVAAGLTGLTIPTYTVLDGLGVRASGSTGGYIAWLFLLEGIAGALLIGVWRGVRRTAVACRDVWALGLTSGVVSLAAYGIVIWAQTQSSLVAVAATRELSILFGALIGHFAFRESFGGRRIAGAALTVAGIVALAL